MLETLGNVAIPVGAAIVVLALLLVLKVALADRSRAKKELRTRARVVLLLFVAIVAVVGIPIAKAAGSLGGRPKSPGASVVASASPASSCEQGNTGALTLTRTTPTRLGWKYEAAGNQAATTHLYLSADKQDKGTFDSTSGEFTVPATPVTVLVEGWGPGGRVHAKCVG